MHVAVLVNHLLDCGRNVRLPAARDVIASAALILPNEERAGQAAHYGAGEPALRLAIGKALQRLLALVGGQLTRSASRQN